MKRHLIMTLLLPIYCVADPFYGESEAQSGTSENVPELVKNRDIQTACSAPKDLEPISLEESFSKLQFIGVLKQNDHIKALFSNENKQIIEMRENQFITLDAIQIHKIEMREVHYIQWKNITHCESPQITIKRL